MYPYPTMAMPQPVMYQQYHNAYPEIHYNQPPSAANGYGWHGNGYGWQLDPKSWHTPPLYPSLQDEVVEEPVVEAQKVEKQNAWNTNQAYGEFTGSSRNDMAENEVFIVSEAREEVLQKCSGESARRQPFKLPKLGKSAVAPKKSSLTRTVYGKNSYPRSVFYRSGVVFHFNGENKENAQSFRVGSSPNVPYIDEEIGKRHFLGVENLNRAKSVSKDSVLSGKYGGKLNNAIVNQIFKFGERGSGTRTKGAQQDFYTLRDQCLERGELFEDPEFPATDSSLFFSQRPDRYYEWKRPGDISENPQLFVEGFSRFDVQQGELGDCWLLAATANLTLYRRLFFQIVPDDQSFDEKYAGIFHFRFWQYGKWIDVVIDDRLPTYRGQLVFLHSTEDNEFWSALLEKAYAKLHGSYEALKGGSTCEAMEDFTGGVTEMYEMQACPPNLFQIMMKAYERASLMGCSIEPDPNIVEAQTPEGLVRGHAYSITRVQYVDIQTPNVTGKIPLLRLRNPWGNESEWNGAWSDGAPEWRFIGESEKEELGLTFDHDGEFWISFKDFQQHFSRVEICNLNPDSLSEEELQEGNKKKWVMSVYEGEWVRGVTAGGCRNFLESFWRNPQYRITLTDVDEGDDEGKCTLIIGLMQKNRRQARSTGGDLLTVGFAIYHLPYPDQVPKPLDLNFFKYNASVARSPSFINLREVSCRFKLPPGTYCIVPSTFDPNEEGEFLLRVFSEHQNNMEEHDGEIGYGEMDPKTPTARTERIDEDGKVSEVEPMPEEQEQTDKIYEFFLKIAGEDREIDWKELQRILDFSMQTEIQGKQTSKTRKHTNDVNAIPSTNQPTQQDQGLLNQLFTLICGTVCKDTPLAEFISQQRQVNPVMASFSELNKGGFSKDVCRSMVAMLDFDRSGKLGYEEFKTLWTILKRWKDIWSIYDKDSSGSFSGFELKDALDSAGYKLNNHILNAIMHRYGSKQGEVYFDDFLMCAIKLKTMMDIFHEKNRDNKDAKDATFSLGEWLEVTLYS